MRLPDYKDAICYTFTMKEELWNEVDRYIVDSLVRPDAALEAAARANVDAGLPPIGVSPNQGKLLMLLAKLQGARAILEVGTLGGYSTIWLARGLAAGGHLITLELNADYATVARRNIARAGRADSVEIRIGPADDSLRRLVEEGGGPFDLIFIDADKASYPLYLEWALKLSRAGTLIIADNVVRKGAVVDPANDDPNVIGIRRFYEAVANERRVDSTAIQTLGSKGYDGFAFVLVKDL
jgi:predicted O-methyltransferase YrrM